METPSKRTRKPNFSAEEVSTLLQEIASVKHVLLSTLTNEKTNKRKLSLWLGIAEKVSACGVAQRSVCEVRDKWKNFKAETVKKQNDHRKTNGGPPRKPVPFEQVVLTIIGEDSVVSMDIPVKGSIKMEEEQSSTHVPQDVDVVDVLREDSTYFQETVVVTHIDGGEVHDVITFGPHGVPADQDQLQCLSSIASEGNTRADGTDPGPSLLSALQGGACPASGMAVDSEADHTILGSTPFQGAACPTPVRAIQTVDTQEDVAVPRLSQWTPLQGSTLHHHTTRPAQATPTPTRLGKRTQSRDTPTKLGKRTQSRDSVASRAYSLSEEEKNYFASQANVNNALMRMLPALEDVLSDVKKVCDMQVRKAEAEYRKAEMEARKAEMEARKAEIEVKQAELDLFEKETIIKKRQLETE